MDKKVIRKKMIKKRQGLSMLEYNDKSCSIITRLRNHPFYKEAKTIGIYVSFNKEVDTYSYLDLLCQEKQVCIPKTKGKEMDFFVYDKNNLEENQYGILETKDSQKIKKENIDLLVIPLVAYHDSGYRVGYGGGYYDRYLKDYKGHTIGLAFEFQKIEEIDFEEFDQKVELVIHENN
ncbi:5-formyltetrahydrofolate cyclo-ligase [Tannockella kyphosi]|uniref:5-formyltetrahydrofolate cyclo-ligase n=1 Tax=Tannockella kyphosi TaxID=2899121 RepID=UPI002012322A|nr:5-formyltetrahydrofolate cyclo-ligase [Tannockella kyphosi]